MEVYGAFNSVPDYSAPAPTLRSLHHSLEGAIKALYPDNEHFQQSFTKGTYPSETPYWNGPDGFGLVKLMKVLP